MRTLPSLITVINVVTGVLGKLRPANLIEKFLVTFIDEETGELNNNGVVLAGVFLVIAILIVGYLEGGGALPWE